MSNIVRTVAALLSMAGDTPVYAGDNLRSAGGYDVKLISPLPDADGMVTVQGYPMRVTPSEVGLYFRPASVSIMDMDEGQAGPVVAAYQREDPPPPPSAPVVAAEGPPPDFSEGPLKK